jgi:hypothetical protein
MKLTTHLHLVPRLKMCGAIPPLHCTPQNVFMAWQRYSTMTTKLVPEKMLPHKVCNPSTGFASLLATATFFSEYCAL